MIYRASLFVCVFSVVSIQLNAQQNINGKITDENSQPIPFVYIYLTSSKIATITNEQGEFELRSFADLDSLVISHITYEDQKIRLRLGYLEISLTPKIITLAELVVTDFAGQCIRKTYSQTINNILGKKFGKGFYRQISYNDSIPTEILEVFYALQTSCAGVEKESIEEARYALKKKEKSGQRIVQLTNFSGFVTSSKVVSEQNAQQKSILVPLMPRSENFYDFTMVDQFRENNSDYLKIHFKPLIDCPKPALEGDLVLNAKTFKIIRMDSHIRQSLIDDLKSPSGKELKTFNHLVTMRFDFREEGTSTVLNYVTGNYFLEFLDDTNELHSFSVNASLVMYQQDLTKIKRLKDVTLEKNDLNEIKKKKYNASFWKENSIIKRTPLEDKVIERFEKDGSFGTLFSTNNHY